ncbi:unnamed protein product [Mytilus coruscus]|uniref:Reverse transcriptase domain-containing protein n=1 Tax=Mytilus coruscus TaxID=42192 RepID=A0A6J8D6T4_MYTCO|nr:unnamed protein product [Mytilus coruscus]
MSAQEANGVCINMNQYEDLNSKLEEIEKIKCQGAISRPKGFWSVDGDKNTAYILRLEKQRQHSKLITELKDNEGKVSRDTGEILDIIFNFYSNLYSCVKTNNDNKNKMLNFLSSTIDISDYETCESDITFDEIYRSVNGMKKGKTPGPDGLNCECYCKFINEFKDIFFSHFQLH